MSALVLQRDATVKLRWASCLLADWWAGWCAELGCSRCECRHCHLSLGLFVGFVAASAPRQPKRAER